MVKFTNKGGFCGVSADGSEVSFLCFLVYSCFPIRQMPSKQCQSFLRGKQGWLSLHCNFLPFFLIRKLLANVFCLCLSPLKKKIFACDPENPEQFGLP